MLVALMGALSACGSDDDPKKPGPSVDAAADVVSDSAVDAAADASADSGSDAGTDSGPGDAAADSTPVDSGVDGAPGDAQPDSPADATADAPADAGPDAAPKPNYAFVTSTKVTPGDLDKVTGATSGLDGADILCNQAASAAALPGNYVAWLSAVGTDAIDRLTGARGWMRTDGVPFADQPSMFSTGAHWVPLNHDENGVEVSELVVTGTSGSGKGSGTLCGGWASTTGSTVGASSNEMGRTWTSSKVPSCSGSYRLYCFGVDKSVQLSPQQATGRNAFVSSAKFVPGPAVGIGQADTLCQSEATTANLPGTYKALLAADGKTAISRFNTTGNMWVRTDGIPFGTLADLLAGKLKTAIHVHADGKNYSSQGFVFTGASKPDVAGSAAGTCGDWLSAAANGQGGSLLGPGSAFAGFSPSCSSGAVVYCFQE